MDERVEGGGAAPGPPDSEALLHNLALHVPQLIVTIDISGFLTSVSPTVTAALGWSRDDVCGRPFVEFVEESSRDGARAAFEGIVERGMPVDGLRLALRRKDGGTFWGELEGGPFEWHVTRSGAIAVIRDIASRLSVEAALRESEERYRVLFDGINDAVFVNEILEGNEPGRFLQVNDVACRRLGYTRDELLTMTPRDISTPDAYAGAADKRESLARLGNEIIESIHVTRDGRHLAVEGNVHHFQYLGRTAALSISRDITDRKRAENERLEMERRMLHVQKLESLGVLAGGIAHDFNNILVAVLGYADLAMSETSPASPVRASLMEIENAARRAADLCRQMLAYSGRGRFVIEPVHLSDLVAGMMHLARASVSRRAAFNIDLAQSLPPIEGDATQLRQVVMNLVTNASEALDERGGVVSVSTSAVRCSAAELRRTLSAEDPHDGLYVCLAVSDTGVGMAPETIARIFEPFFTTKFTGRGLGMAAVQGIIRGHRGAIDICSEIGTGTTFRVYFPVSTEVPVGTGGTPETTAVAGWHGAGLVLVVDDEESVRRLARLMLVRMGFDVVMAANGQEALRLFQAARHRVSLVLLDLTMPEMDGERTLHALRAVSPDVPVVMSSGYTEQEITARLAGQGVAGFVQKPYTQASLLATVRTAIEGR